MGIRARDLGQVKAARDLQGEAVFLLRAAAVEHFDGVHQRKDHLLGGLGDVGRVKGFVVIVEEGKLGVELVAEGMIGDQQPPAVIRHPAQFLEPVDSADVTIQAEGAHMADLSGDLHAAQQYYAGLSGEALDLLHVPDMVVFGHAYRADSNLARPLDDLLGRYVGVGTAAAGVQMKVNCEVGPVAVPASV